MTGHDLEGFEPALAEQLEAQARGLALSDPTGPLHRWDALRKLDELEQRFAAGDNFALLHAIRVCVNHDLVIPRWAALAYISRFDRVLTCATDSWDHAFGQPYPQGIHLAAAQLRRQLRFLVWRRIRDLVNSEGAAINKKLFRRVGEEFEISEGLSKKLYYQVRTPEPPPSKKPSND